MPFIHKSVCRTDLLRIPKLMRTEKYGDSFGSLLLNQRIYILSAFGVKAGSRLIQKQNLRTVK